MRVRQRSQTRGGRAVLLLSCLLSLGACGTPPAVVVVDAQEIGLLGQSKLIVGRDGGWSASLFGHAVWIFGDSFVTVADVDGSTFHPNSFAIAPGFDASHGIAGLTEPTDKKGSPQTLVPPTATEAAFIAAHRGDTCQQKPCGARFAAWPGPAVYDAARKRALLSYGLVYAEPGAFNFHGVGQSLAVWTDANGIASRPDLYTCPDHPSLLFCQDEPAWGSEILLDDKDPDLLYGFACQKNGLGYSCMLSRVPLAQALDRGAWQGWNGGAWSALSEAKPLFDGALNMRVFYNAHAATWMAAYSAPLSNEVVYRTAPALTGPWSDQTRLFIADHKQNDGGWTYDALVQPGYSQDGGRILYVTYSRPNGTFFGSEFAVVRVTLQ